MQPEYQAPKKASNKKTGIIILAVIAALAVFWLGIGATISIQTYFGQQTTNRETPEVDGNQITSDDEKTTANVAKNVSPSVVSIVTEVRQSSAYWGDVTQSGAGSGVIVDSSGIIVTNKHVVEGAAALQVILDDGSTIDNVKVLATDPLNDLAFLKISSDEALTAAELGDSSTIKIGQKAIAIGNSLGQYQNTVTSGIISATGRPVAASSDSSSDDVTVLTDLLQTDAAINPGNSGGPLLNAAGQVIGINTAIAADAEGIGFAIPVNATKGILKQLVAGHDAKRAYIGVRSVPVNAQVAKEYKLAVNEGAYVYANGKTAVESGSPAEKAGIKEKDVIVKINDVMVGPSGGVASLVAEYAPGDVIDVVVNRGGKEISMQITLGAYTS